MPTIIPVIFPITEPQARLLLKRIHWASGSFTQEDGEKIYRLVKEAQLDKRDASALIDDLKYMNIPHKTEEEEKAHEIGMQSVRQILSRYN